MFIVLTGFSPAPSSSIILWLKDQSKLVVKVNHIKGNVGTQDIAAPF